MGNTASSPREAIRDDQAGQAEINDHERQSTHLRDNVVSSPRSMFSPSRYSTISSDRTRQPQQMSTNTTAADNDYPLVEERVFEQEDRPLVLPQDSVFPESLSHTSLNRRHSTMARLGSRLLPDAVARGLLSSGEETAEEGQALRRGISSRSRLSVYHRRVPSTSTDRFSIGGSLRRRMEPRLEPTRRSVRSLFPLATQHEPLQNDSNTTFDLPESQQDTPMEQESGDRLDRLQRRRTRLSRARASISVPLSYLFGGSQARRSSGHGRDSPPMRLSRIVHAGDSVQLLPPLSNTEHRNDFDESPHELDAVEPETRNILSSSRITSGMSTIRRFPHGLRSRSTRLIRRGEHPPLSQVLQLAAAAIAAQLSGNSPNRPDGTSNLGGEAFDGSIQNFVRTLQDAASAQAGENIDLNASDGDLPPVNFMRVFQFPNDENGAPMTAQGRQAEAVDFDGNQAHGDTDRSVTLVLVGVRSMPNIQDGSPNEAGTLGPSLDTLLSLPFLPPANILRNGSSGALFRRSDTRVRPQNRRHSLTNFNFPQQYETQRHHRSRASAPRGADENGLLTPNHNSPTPISESPPGPHPPPSTPADIRSGHATPSRRPSSASAAQAPNLPNLDENPDQDPSVIQAESSFNTARQRRRSDSEFARRPELSSGNSRRNGMVEPDRNPTGVGRSWLIYVVGTNVSPDHPAFTMPSLFTDNPSYEDMQMLSTLLGPVKPPVATQDDIDSAGGLYRIALQDGVLVAQAQAEREEPVFSISEGERCLICLSDYEVGNEVRQIIACQHLYHRECVDEWLTTGRNSCPMCRRPGVKENGASSSTSEGPEPEEVTAS